MEAIKKEMMMLHVNEEMVLNLDGNIKKDMMMFRVTEE